MTNAPNSLATASAMLATPPPIPQISTTSPGRTLARVFSMRQAVNAAKE